MITQLEVPKTVHEKRLQICDSCPLLIRSESIGTSRCGDCGCFVYVKSLLKDFTCPQGKW
jgi:hypothetical protein